MHATTTTFSGDPADLAAALSVLRERAVPALQRLPGCVGASVLVDRGDGTCLVTSAWHDAAAQEAADQQERELLHEVGAVLPAGERRRWEIAALHRERPLPAGAQARVTWTRVPPELVEEQLHVFRAVTLPLVCRLPGFCSASVVVDRETGSAAVATVYESREALAASRRAASSLRADTLSSFGAQVAVVRELEVELAHLRVPETV